MKPLSLSILFITLFNYVSLGQTDTSIVTKLSVTVLALRNGESSGTGSFIMTDSNSYIVTASHVAKLMNQNTILIIQGDHNKPITLKITDLANPVIWLSHPNADLSVLKIAPSKTIYDLYLKRRFVPIKMIDTSLIPVPRNLQLTTLGFPLGIGDFEYFSPLSYRSYPSSEFITLPRFDTKVPQTFIILENPSVSGYSGGPVYETGEFQTSGIKSFSGHVVLHGFIHGTISDRTGGKLTAMTPAFYLRDLIK